MGPLVPFEIIGSEFNYIIAIVLGFFFGYILEQAGFSSSRKLVGVFYGYDLVVLKVFFTAAITAMIGIIFFDYFGWVDASFLYVNPTFLWPAIVGGAIMGVGFLLGGFCPGTSITAATIGRIDAMVFIAGILLGVFIWGESYPAIESFYKSSAFGGIKVYDSLGISRGFFALLLIIIALLAFGIGEYIEKNRMNKLKLDVTGNRQAKTGMAAFVLVALGVIILFIPANRQARINEISAKQLLTELNSDEHYITPDEVAFRIMDRDDEFRLIDVRPSEEYREFSLPKAVNVPLENIANRQMIDFLNPEDESEEMIKVFYSNSGMLADKAWMIYKRLGYKNFYVLKGGLNNMVETIFHYDDKPKPVNPLYKEALDTYRFRKNASEYFRGMEREVKTGGNKSAPKFEVIQVEGGC
ncbi:MAG: YeeE/YedE family protein [Bacteroidales bacterium]|nr:YeeE/YedE family protein [Bacteroidales bacterium]